MDKPDPSPSPKFIPRTGPRPEISARGPRLQLGVPWDFEWNRFTLPIPSLPPELEGFRIAQISDLHLRSFWSPVYDELIAKVQAEAPDAIFMTGDFVNNKRNHDREAPFARRLVSQLSAPFGIFGVLGNHDRYGLPPQLEGTGIKLLDGCRHEININGSSLELLGLPGVDRRDVTPPVLASFPPRQPGVPRLILSHFPDVLTRALPLEPDIYFAGHTHGGQVCLPGGTPIIRHDSLPRQFGKGIHKIQDTWLVVSRGMGFTGISVRLFCPAEVIEITLTRNQDGRAT